MASLYASGTGTTAATATLVSPPGKAADAIGPKYTVIDSITLGVSAGAATAVSAGTLEIQNNGVGQGQIHSAFQLPAGNTETLNLNFLGGLLVPHVAAGNVTIVATGYTGATQTRLLVTYHYE